MSIPERSRGLRFIQALALHRFWKFRWYHAVPIWLALFIYGWGASPYFMAHVVGAPEPGVAPRYVGSIRTDGRLERTKNGWKPPRYFIRIVSGDVEFHCGYLPYRKECWLYGIFEFSPSPEDVYEIGYDKYWGVDYIGYPEALRARIRVSNGEAVRSWRDRYLQYHARDLTWFIFYLGVYVVLVLCAYHRNGKRTEAPSSNPLPPSAIQ